MKYKLYKLYLKLTDKFCYDLLVEIEKLSEELEVARKKHKKSSDLEKTLKCIKDLFEMLRG